MLPRKLTISWLRKQYVAGTLSPETVIAEIIKRVQEHREKNIWIVEPDLATLAPLLEGLKNLSIPDHPLWGIPFAIKDNIDLAGTPTSAACPAYRYTPATDAAVVRNLIAAGALPLGKTNLDQFATGLVGTRSPYGEVHNAINDDYISGGSSAGSAAAVALGQAAFSLGTDTAGSGRVPAALNGLYGFKPARGAWSILGVVPACESLDCVTVFAHDLEDCAVVDEAARNFETRDKWSRHLPPLGREKPRFICLPRQEPEFFGDLAEAYRGAWRNFTGTLEKSGLPVRWIDTEIFNRAAAILYDGPWIAERWEALGAFVESHGDAIFPVTKTILSSGNNLSAHALFKALHDLEDYRQQVRQILDGGVLVMPTTGGTWTRDQVRKDPVLTNSKLGLYTNHCNLLDLSALALPWGEAGKGFPFGVTVFAVHDRESYLIFCGELFRRMALAAGEKRIVLAVHGLHMRGMPLNPLLLDLGGEFLGEALTAPEYRLFALNTEPAKPGLIHTGPGGYAIATELWSLPPEGLGRLVETTPAPLGFGKIRLSDGTEAEAYLCEDYATRNARDISALGGWRQFLQSIADANPQQTGGTK